MAKIEIDESQYQALTQVSALHQAMLANPEARGMVQRALKTVKPDLAIPEIDAKNEVLGEVGKLREQMAEMAKQREEERAAAEAKARTDQFSAEWEKGKSKLRKAGYTDEGVDAIEKLAQERGIADLEAASALFDKLNPPQAPVQPTGIQGWDMFQPEGRETDHMKKLMESRGEDEMALSAMVSDSLNDIRGVARR